MDVQLLSYTTGIRFSAVLVCGGMLTRLEW